MRLLLAEDDPSLGPRLKTDLVHAGFAVDLVNNGLDAEHLGHNEPYDLVILDLGLPQKSGLEILSTWRARNNNVPVIILTARDAWHERVSGFKAGADDYLGKPFHGEELLARIHAVIKRHYANGSANEILDHGGIFLDEARQTATLRNGTTFELTGTEFRLLRYLMLHPNQILSKTRITDHVYEYDTDRDSNVIEVYVKRLRNKLGDDAIETRRGQGYIFRGIR